MEDTMNKRFGLAIAAIIAMGCSQFAAPPPGGGLEGLAHLSDARTRRVSSFNAKPDINANADRIGIKPGETVTLADIQGPGAITHFWCTIASKDPTYPRSLVLRMYWDGGDEPAVEAPIGDFFAVGHGLAAPVNSIPVQVSSEGRARNCFWRMPFRKSARITVTNDSPNHQTNAFYYYIDYEELPSLPRDTPYFHAQYRQEHPCGAGDYLILDAVGKGHFVGTVLSVENTRARWFGEGDDRFYIDGDKTPTLHGTGTEDYFSDAWGFRHFNNPYYGCTVFEGMHIGGRTTVYRWHITDPIRFEESLRFEIEHTGPIMDIEGQRLAPYGERSDHYSSVAFWYQAGKAKRFAEIPPVDERLPHSNEIEGAGLLDRNGVRVSAGAEASGANSDFRLRGSPLWFQPSSPGVESWIEVDFPVAEAGPFHVALDLVHSAEKGAWKIMLNGQPAAGRVVLESPEMSVESHSLGVCQMNAGKNILRFEPLDGERVKLGLAGIRLKPIR
jgi:hypothetical protein